ncbi:hypothetical protein ACS96_30735 [Pseudomonas aeruginosa]|nr:hypothetical protein ACS96_30735 [Pseudomonas aeruginosa]
MIVATATDPTGNTGPQAATTVDAVAPPAPVIDPSNGTTISGTAEAGAKVILTDGNGNPIGETTADGSGNWTFTPATPLANGTVVNAVAQDPAGNTGPQGSTTVDAVAPNTPVVNPSNGNLLNGTAEPGSTVTLTDGNGNPIGQTTADGSGNWSFTPGSQLPNGTVVNVTASDAAGNTSLPATTTVDSSLPSIPQVDPSNGSVISGTADAGNTIIITDGNGNPIGQVTADGSGNWSFTPGIPLPDGTVVNVVARSPSNVDSAPAVITVDGVAPAAPVIDPSNGTEISGTAEAGATVILTDGGGNPIGQATADGSGNWTFTPGTPLANGTVINAVAQDPAGNTSGPASVTVDAIAPPAPVIDPSNGVVISGTAEAGATVILTDGNGNPVGQVTADGSGNWAFTPATPLANGTVINALAQDAAGNNSSPTSATVDSLAPAAPVIDPSNGSVIAGTAEAGATVILTDGNGNPIGQVTADGSGNWSFTPGTPLSNGTVVNAVAQDAAGNTSGPASTTVDSVAPAAPVIDPSNGSVIAGTAEAGATVILTDGGGNPIGQATADGSGNWTFTPGTPLANGTVINAVAQDPAGNTSGPASTTVDAVAPATPVVNPSNGSVIAGTAEAGATVILTDGGGNPIGQATADGSGNWSFTPGTPLANGSVVNAVAQDAAGNTSGPASTTVDSVAPATPVLDPSNGTVISGTAEAGATVILTDGGGNPIGQATADGSGNWSFTPGTPLANGSVINHRRQRQPDRPGHRRWQRQLELHARHAAVQWHGCQCGGPGRCRQHQRPGQHHGGLGGAGRAGDRPEQRQRDRRYRGSRCDGDPHRWRRQPDRPGHRRRQRQLDVHPGHATGQRHGDQRRGPGPGRQHQRSGQHHGGRGGPGHPGGQPEQRQRDRRYRGSRRHGDPHRRRRQPDRPGHCRWQRQLELHPGHTAGQRLGGQCGGPGRRRQHQRPGQHHGGLGSPGHPGARSEQRYGDQRYRRSRRHGDPHRWRRQPDRAGHRRWQRQLELHPGHSAGQRLGDQCGGPGRRRQHQRSGQHHGGRCGPGHPGDRPEQWCRTQRHRRTRRPGDPHRWQWQPDRPDPCRRQRQLELHAGHAAGQRHGGQRRGPGPGRQYQRPGQHHGGHGGSGHAGDQCQQRQRDHRDRRGRRQGDPHRWQRQPDRRDHRRRQWQLDLHPRHAAGQRYGDQRRRRGRRGQLTDGNGNPVGQVTADGSGNWAFTPATPLANGTVINALAQDAAGNNSSPTSATVDSLAPAAPVIDPSNGSVIAGTAEAGATVILTDGNGNPIGQVTADGSGNWSFTPGTPLSNGTVVNAVAQDAAGNTSGPASTTVDSVAPAAPVIDPSNGSVIAGTAEAGATVILTDGGGNPIGQATADGSGNWTFTPGTPLANGTVINAVAQDPAGNTSGPASTTVDAVAPATPVVNPSNGSVIAGTAEAGATVILTDGGGNPIGQATADGSGNWSFTPGTPLANGSVVNAVAQDAAGNTSGPASTTVDSVAPATPVLDPSNGTVISGTAEAGATVILTDGGGNPIGQATADGSGNWSFTPGTPLANGSVINAVAQDAAGNTSGPVSTTVDAVAPATPVIDPSNGVELSGTAEPGVRVILTDGNGNPIGQTLADGSGNWSFTPGTPLANGTVVNAVAQDPAGNTSGPASTTVDTVAPATPVINASNGSVITGTAEVGAKVILTDGNGNPIGETTADGSGNWTFTPGTPLANGTVINAVAEDAAGNASGPASTTVDSVAPSVTDGGGNPIGQATADGSGNWTFTPGTPLANGTVINAVAQDPAGNTSGPASVTVDAIAPPAPVIDPSNGVVISGTAEAGATVILTDGNGNPVGQVTADGSGNWAFTPATPLANGTVINALAQDAAGNNSSPTSATVDSLAPAAPVIDPSNGSVIAGTAEAGATVILTDGNGNPIGQVTADGSGNWSFTPGTPLSNGTVVNAVAQDAAGNTSGPASTTVDSVAPAAPVIDPSNGSVIAGTAEAGATVILTDGGGNPIGQATADGSGNWTFTPGTPLANGTVINAVAQDPAGNTSGPASTTVDAVAPATPVVNPSNGSVIAGTAEAGATVILTDGGGNPIGQATADGSGNWSFTPGTPLANGSVVNAVAQDAAGNTSGPASTTVDSVAPATPVLDPSNGTVISGTAEAGATVILTDGGGNPIGQATADGSGNWSFTPGTPLANGSVINAVAQDAAGNTSGPVSTTVDAVAPATPVIDPSNGVELSGTAEPGVRVILTDGNGNPIGQTLADGSGNWSFTPGTPLANGTVVNAVAQDPAGNTSGPASTTVDTVAPATPVINASNGSVITGTAEVGAKVILTDGNGNPIGETTADGSGNWTFTPGTPLANGTVINAVAEDAAGNASGPASTTVDSVAPSPMATATRLARSPPTAAATGPSLQASRCRMARWSTWWRAAQAMSTVRRR